jgi:outer membrane biosynthesis protein TonB
MSAVAAPQLSIRLGRAESKRLAWAFLISVILHLLAYGTYEGGRRLHLWERVQWPAWMVAPRMLTDLFVKPPSAQALKELEKRREEEEKQQQIPLMFIEVNPAQAVAEAPQKAQYYAARNSKAANPDATVQSSIPKIDGKQKEVAKTEDVPRTKMFPLRPTTPAPPPQVKTAQPKPEPIPQPKPEPIRETKPDPIAEAKLKMAMAAGNMVMGRPEDTTQKAVERADPSRIHPRPRRLIDVPPEVRYAALAGEKMKQEGGVARRQLISSVDAVASPFGAYDEAVISAVQQRWYLLLDDQGTAGSQTGKVTLRFHLNSDGSVSEMKLVDSTVDLTLALICQSAVRDPAPFAPWPAEMRKEIGAKFREVTFAFYYR